MDNTFATPYLQRPLELGADIVAHSLTKYLGEHSDVVGGALVTDDEGLDEQLGFYQNSVGATPDPFACFLVLRGTKTLPVRMDRHSGNARDLAAWLDDHQSLTLLIWLGRTIRHLMPPTLWIECLRVSSGMDVGQTAASIGAKRRDCRRKCPVPGSCRRCFSRC